MTKAYSIYKDITGMYDRKHPVLSFTETEYVVLDHDDPFIYTIINENENPFLIKLTYTSNGYISYGNESGCLAWVKVKDKISDVGYQKIALSPEFVILEGGNEIQIYGARVFDQDFSVQIETFKLQIN